MIRWNVGLGQEWEDHGREDEEASIEVDFDGNIIAINSFAVLMFDYHDANELIGHPLSKCLLMGSETDEVDGIVQLAMGCVCLALFFDAYIPAVFGRTACPSPST